MLTIRGVCGNECLRNHFLCEILSSSCEELREFLLPTPLPWHGSDALRHPNEENSTLSEYGFINVITQPYQLPCLVLGLVPWC